jgi:hypothetical protein
VVRHQLAVQCDDTSYQALLATLSRFPAPPMTDSKNRTPDNSLPAELELALRRATQGAINALHSLRTAVEEHVHKERSRGATHREVDADLQFMIETAYRACDADHPAARIDEVTRQVLIWSASIYTPRA